MTVVGVFGSDMLWAKAWWILHMYVSLVCCWCVMCCCVVDCSLRFVHLTFNFYFVDVFFVCHADVGTVVVSYVALLLLFVFPLNSCVGGFSLIGLEQSCCLNTQHVGCILQMLLWFGLGLVHAWFCVGLLYGFGLGLGHMWFECMGLIVSLGFWCVRAGS